MKLVRNTDALVAWAQRHGLDASTIKDGAVGVRLPDGRTRYELEELVGWTYFRGTPIWRRFEFIAPADDPMPTRWVIG